MTCLTQTCDAAAVLVDVSIRALASTAVMWLAAALASLGPAAYLEEGQRRALHMQTHARVLRLAAYPGEEQRQTLSMQAHAHVLPLGLLAGRLCMYP